MRAPDFWWRPDKSLVAMLLTPFSWVYASLAARRMTKTATRIGIPVICVGNFTAGGAGKTPTAIALCQILQATGENPFFLSRGYGGTEEGPLFANPSEHLPEKVGDEPLLLGRHAPTVVSRDRIAGACLARNEGATVIIMDDGMQNPYLAKDLTLSVVDGGTGVGNGLALPAGPLRMTMQQQWPLTDAVVIVGPGEVGDRIATAAAEAGKPVFRASLHPNAEAVAKINGRRVLAFAGIGRPEKFYETLRACGALVEQTVSFPDHHAFSDEELSALLATAERKGLIPVTTEKDHMRIVRSDPAEAIKVLPVEMAFASDDIAELLNAALKRARGSSLV